MLLAQQKEHEYIKKLAFKFDTLSTHNKMLEAQITHQATSSLTPPGRLSSKSGRNPRVQCNAMILRGESNLKDLRGSTMMSPCLMQITSLMRKSCLLPLKV